MNLAYFHQRLQDGKIHDRLIPMIGNEDPIYCVLSIHLVFERMLEIWIESYTNIPDILADASMSFKTKLTIARNCSLPTEIYLTISKINVLRNAISHRIDKNDITDAEIKHFTDLIKKVPSQSNLNEIDSFSLNTGNDFVTMKDANNTQKFCIIGMLLFTSMIYNFNNLSENK